MTDIIKPKLEEIKNCPKDTDHVYVEVKSGRIYLVKKTRVGMYESGRPIYSSHNLGRVIDGVFYTMEEYQKTHKRTGELREPDEAQTPNRKYERKKPASERKPGRPPKYADNLPDKDSIENFPHHIPKARVINMPKKAGFYVVVTEYYRADGKNKRLDHYLGRVKDNRFYTMEEYRATFKRDGTRRDGSDKKEQE